MVLGNACTVVKIVTSEKWRGLDADGAGTRGVGGISEVEVGERNAPLEGTAPFYSGVGSK